MVNGKEIGSCLGDLYSVNWVRLRLMLMPLLLA